MITPEAKARAEGIVETAVLQGATLMLDGRHPKPPVGYEKARSTRRRGIRRRREPSAQNTGCYKPSSSPSPWALSTIEQQPLPLYRRTRPLSFAG
jgi:hypothetical protein